MLLGLEQNRTEWPELQDAVSTPRHSPFCLMPYQLWNAVCQMFWCKITEKMPGVIFLASLMTTNRCDTDINTQQSGFLCITLGRRQSKTLIAIDKPDQNLLETVFLIVICCRRQMAIKNCFLRFFINVRR